MPPSDDRKTPEAVVTAIAVIESEPPVPSGCVRDEMVEAFISRAPAGSVSMTIAHVTPEAAAHHERLARIQYVEPELVREKSFRWARREGAGLIILGGAAAVAWPVLITALPWYMAAIATLCCAAEVISKLRPGK